MERDTTIFSTSPSPLLRTIYTLFFIVSIVVMKPCHALSFNASTPEWVVESFCNSYSEGNGLDTATWHEVEKFTIWRDAPGWDTIKIVKYYRITPLEKDRKSAKVRVVFHNVGQIDSGVEFSTVSFKKETENIEFDLSKSENEWKISKPVIPPHVSISKAIAILTLEMNNMTAKEKAKRKDLLKKLSKSMNKE